MMQEEHATYLALTTIRLPHRGLINPYLCLCCFCRHSLWVPGACSLKAHLFCEMSPRTEPGRVAKAGGQDCRWFEPLYVLEDCVDGVGIHLQGLTPDGATIRRLPGVQENKWAAVVEEHGGPSV